jgi:DNA-binding transcriptional ArsR family regulator
LAASDPEQALKELDEVFAALSHPARRQVLLFLQFRGGAMSAGDIAGRFRHAWPTTTRHLAVLENAGLLTHERQGRGRIYRLDTSKLDAIRRWLVWFEPDVKGARRKEKAHGSKRKSGNER